MTEAQLPLPTLSRADQIEEAFNDFDQANPHVWKLFVRYSQQIIAAGHKRSSADMVMHRIRWNMNIDTIRSGEFKVNNNFSAMYARKWQSEFPADADLFETRIRTSEKRVMK